MPRKFEIEEQITTLVLHVSIQHWETYDDSITSLADGNERMAWLAADQPERTFRLVEVLS